MGEGVRLYAGTHEGMFVFRSGRSGWTPVSQALISGIIDTVSGCTGKPEQVFAGVAHDGVYRTRDGGLHWERVLAGDVRALAVDPTNDEVVYAGMEPVRLFRSEDSGQHWEEVSTLLQMPREVQVKWWSPVSGAGHVRQIFIHEDDPRIVYLALEHGGIVRSLDRCETWEDVSEGIDYIDMHMVAALPHSTSRYYCSSARGFFTSEDPADGWVRAEKGFTRDYFHDFAFLPPAREGGNPTMLIGCADRSPGSWGRPERAKAAVFRSDDCAQTWRRVTGGLPEIITSMISTIIPHPLDPNAALMGLGEVSRGHAHGEAGPGTIMMTRDRGDHWVDLGIEIPADRVLWAAPE
ncbi:MAG TPA: hypothetical protein VNN19_12295 [bacterium]|nr:hypothetical protein [bacterium]